MGPGGKSVRNLLKRLILGTALEPIARKALAAVKRGAPSASTLYDIQTLEVTRRVLERDSNCVDVGCHKGAILKHILRLAPEGTHVAFEPIPRMYRHLVQTFGARASVHIHDIALSDRAGTASFHHVVANPAFSGLGKRRFDSPEIEEIRVRTDLLDALIPAHVPIRFIKVDVEGAEQQVLRGAIETIRRNRPFIVFEHGIGGADFFGTKPEDVYDLLTRRCGLQILLMSDWLAAESAPALTREGFREQFVTNKNYYFMACP